MSAQPHVAIGLFVAGVLVCAGASPIRAQEPHDPHAAQPERPTVATHAGTVAPGWFEVETGIERDRVAPGISTLSTPTLFKFGVAPRVQFDVTLTAVRPSSRQSLGIGDAGIGVKWRLADDLPVLGEFAVQPSLKFPTGSVNRGTGTGTTDASFLIISSHVIGPVALDVNVGMTRRGDNTNSALWTVSTGTTIDGPWAWAAEVFGYPGFGGTPAPSIAFLTGPTWAIHPWVVADLGVIVNVAGPQPPALYAGLTWNVGRMP